MHRTWGRIWTFFPLNTWLSLTTWGRSQANPFEMHNYGKESCFFLKVHPSLASPQNAMLPFSTNPLPSICRQVFFPLQNAKPTWNASLQILIFHAIFIFLLFFSFHFFSFSFWFFFSFFLFPPKTWNSSPKWKNYSPAFGVNNRRIDAPDWVLPSIFPLLNNSRHS